MKKEPQAQIIVQRPLCFEDYSSIDSINLATASAAAASSSPLAETLMLAPLVTANDKTPIKLLAFAFLPLNSKLTSDLNPDALQRNLQWLWKLSLPPVYPVHSEFLIDDVSCLYIHH